MKFFLSWLIMALSVYITAYILPGVALEGVFASIVVAMLIGIINTTIKPVLIILTLPINIFTLGLFTLVINALLVMLVAALTPGFGVSNFWWAVLFSIVLTIINGFLTRAFKKDQLHA